MPSATLPATYRPTAEYWPSFNSLLVSFMNVENVVNPPHSPVARNNLAEGLITSPPDGRADNAPMMKHPATLTANVPHGKLHGITACSAIDTRNLAPPPMQLPMLTNKKSFIMLSFYLSIPCCLLSFHPCLRDAVHLRPSRSMHSGGMQTQCKNNENHRMRQAYLPKSSHERRN